MISPCIPRRTIGLLLVLAAGTLLRGATPAEPVEKDKRLHADGKSWKFNKAVIEDKRRPRVLLMGDSILGGYMNGVIDSLEGRAYVDAWMHPHAQSENFNKAMAEILDSGPYDVIHFNMGLHGWNPGRIKEVTYEPLTKSVIEVIRKKLPKARIIWANTTPVTVKGKPTELDPEINPIIILHNRMAANVMTEMQVPVNDFYALLSPRLELARGDQFHWKPEAYKVLAEVVVKSLERELAVVVASPAK